MTMWEHMGGKESGVSLAAVRKWVYTARQRGIMPPAAARERH